MPPPAKARNLVGDPLEAVFLACGLAGPVRKSGGKTGVIATVASVVALQPLRGEHRFSWAPLPQLHLGG